MIFAPPYRIDGRRSLARGLSFTFAPPAIPNGTDVYWAADNGAGIAQVGAARTPAWLNYRGNTYWGGAYTTADGDKTQLNSSGIPAIVTSTRDGTGDFSLMILANLPNVASYGRVFSHGKNDGSLGNTAFILSNYSASANTTRAGTLTFNSYNSGFVGFVDADSVLDGNPHVFVMSRNAGAFRMYRDADDVTTRQQTGADTLSIAPSGLTGVCVSGLYGVTESNGMNCTLALALGWNRALTLQEIRQLGEFPEQSFYVPERRIYSFSPPVAPNSSTSSARYYYDLGTRVSCV